MGTGAADDEEDKLGRYEIVSMPCASRWSMTSSRKLEMFAPFKTMLIGIIGCCLNPVVKVIPLRVGLATGDCIEILCSSIGFFVLSHLEVGRLSNGGTNSGTDSGSDRLRLGACSGTGSTGSSSGSVSVSVGRHLGKVTRFVVVGYFKKIIKKLSNTSLRDCPM